MEPVPASEEPPLNVSPGRLRSLGDVNVSDLNEKLEICRLAGAPQVLQLVGSSARETARMDSNCAPQLEHWYS